MSQKELKKKIKKADRSSREDITKHMISESLTKYVFFCRNIKTNFVNVNMANDEQNHSAKYIKEFKRKASAEDSNLKRVKGHALNSAITLLKGR